MREASTVAYDDVRDEFHFICEDPGPVLLMPAAHLVLAVRQRDGSYLATGYRDREYQMPCEFVIRSPLWRLAQSIRPAPAAPLPTTQDASQEPVEAQPALLGWQPAAPAPLDPRKAQLTFFRPTPSVAEQMAEKPFRPEPVQDTRPLERTMDREQQPTISMDTGNLMQDTDWEVHYVMSQPDQRDEAPRHVKIRADSDAAALRAAHAMLRDPEKETSYRITSVIPASMSHAD